MRTLETSRESTAYRALKRTLAPTTLHDVVDTDLGIDLLSLAPARAGDTPATIITAAVSISVTRHAIILALRAEGFGLGARSSRSAALSHLRRRRHATSSSRASRGARGRLCIARRRRAHLEGSAERRLLGRHRVASPVAMATSSRLRNSSYVYDHVMLEIVVRCDDANAFFVLEADAVLVQAVKVLHGCDDRVCRIVRRDHHSHGQTCLYTRVLRVDELEDDVLLLFLGGRGAGIPRASDSAILAPAWTMAMRGVRRAVGVLIVSRGIVATTLLGVLAPRILQPGGARGAIRQHVGEVDVYSSGDLF